MKRMLSLVWKDFLIGFKSFFFPAIIISSVFLSLLTLYVLPSSLLKRSYIFCYIDANDQDKSFFKKQIDAEKSIFMVESKSELIDEINRRPFSYGLIIKSKNGNVDIEAILRGHESDITYNSIKMLSSFISLDPIKIDDIESIILSKNPAGGLPFNKRIIPLLVLFESCIVGFFITVGMFFYEKQSDTLKNILASPSSLFDIVFSKVFTITMISFASGVIIAFMTLNKIEYWWQVVSVILSASFFTTSLGMLIASVFKSIYRSASTVLFALIFLSLPVVSHITNRFDKVLAFFPTRLIIDALESSFFFDGDNFKVFQSTGYTILLGLVCFSLSMMKLRRITVN